MIWSKMIIKLNKEDTDGYFGFVGEHEVLYRNRANSVIFTEDIFAQADG